MRPWCVLLLALPCCSAAEIPAGTPLAVRLLDPVSSLSAKPGAEVRAVTIAPVLVKGIVAIAPHTVLTGKVKSSVSAAKSETQQARLTLQFTAAGKLPIHAVVDTVDNARETVDDTGTIVGIIPKQTFEGLAERGIDKLNQNERYSALGSILGAAKEALVKPVDPEIDYAPGVEMTLRLTKPVHLAAPPDYHPPPPFPQPAEVARMVEVLPYVTYAVDPPQPSDITNVLLVGSEQALTGAFAEAGWSPARQLSQSTGFETALALIEARGYKEAPVSLLLLDQRPPDLVFEKTNNTFAMRHHVRIWRMSGDFDGIPVWACSATHDSGIDLRQETFTFIHRVESNIDLERSKLVDDLVFTGRVKQLTYVDRPKAPRSFHNATGDAIVTDGRMAVLSMQ